jgi:hypothetical protein
MPLPGSPRERENGEDPGTSQLDNEMVQELEQLLQEDSEDHSGSSLARVSSPPLPDTGEQLAVCDVPMEPVEPEGDDREASPGIERGRAHFRNPYEEAEEAEVPGASSSGPRAAEPAVSEAVFLDSCNTASGKLNLLIVPKYVSALESPRAAELPHLELCTTHANRRWVFAICSVHEAGREGVSVRAGCFAQLRRARNAAENQVTVPMLAPGPRGFSLCRGGSKSRIRGFVFFLPAHLPSTRVRWIWMQPYRA